jgi:hypothetical protein
MTLTYKTSDIYLASTLLTLGYTLETVDKSERKAMFVFGDTEGLRNDVKEYNARRIALVPQDLFYSMRTLKEQLYNNEN